MANILDNDESLRQLLETDKQVLSSLAKDELYGWKIANPMFVRLAEEAKYLGR